MSYISTDLLPHFTPQLWGALEERLTRRIEQEYRTDYRLHKALKDAVMMPRQFAHEVVARIYRTQYKDGLWLIRWSEVMIAANPKPAEDAKAKLDAIFRKPQSGLIQKFRSV